MKHVGTFLLLTWFLLGGKLQAAGALQGVLATTNLRYQVSAVDTFRRSNAAFTTPWTVTPGFPGNFEVSSDTAIVSSLGTDDNWYYSTVSPPANQWAGVILGMPGTAADTEGYGVSVLVSNSAQTILRVTCSLAGFEVFKIVAGAGSDLPGSPSTSTTCTAGDFLSIGIDAAGNIIVSKNWQSIYTANDTSIATGQLGISYSSTATGGSILQWMGGTYNQGSAPAPPSGQVFPEIGVQAISNGQTFASSAILKLLAQYQYVQIGGNFYQWPATESSASGGVYTTRDQIVQGLKSFTGSGGKNSVLPLVVQYENFLDYNNTSLPFPEWSNAVAGNNWYMYVSGSSGTKSTSAAGASYVTVNPAHVVGTDSFGGTGLYPMALAAKLMYQRYFLGTGTAGTAMASTHLDGYYVDDVPPRNIFGGPADPLRNGTNPSQTDPTATSATAVGKADFYSELASLYPTTIRLGNSEFGYDLSSTSTGALGMSPNATSGIYQKPMQQFMYGSVSGQSNVLNFGGFSGFMTWYQNLDANAASGGQSILTGGFTNTDYQRLRYSLGATLMRNGIFVNGSATYFSGSLPSSDLVDPTNSSSFPNFDEFWCGVAALAGCLGTASATSQGAVQTSAWMSGVWRRDFQYGIVLVNPAGNGSQTFTSTQLAGTFYYMDGTQDHTHNPGGSTPVSSVTLAAGDAIYLMRTAQP